MEHADAHRERLLGRLVFAGVSWVVFHVWSAVYNGALFVFNHGYDNCGWQIYALPAAYLLSLLLFDGLAYFAKSLTAGRVLAEFWAVCTAMIPITAAASLICGEIPTFMILPILLLPAAPLLPILDLMMEGAVPVLAAVFGLSAGHVAYFLWVHRLARDHKDRRTDGSRSWRTQNK